MTRAQPIHPAHCACRHCLPVGPATRWTLRRWLAGLAVFLAVFVAVPIAMQLIADRLSH